MKASGIYTITSPSGGVYVGSAIVVRRRWHEHRIALRANRHKNRKLQNAWNKHGEFAMAFAVLIVCRPEDLLLFEQRAIDVMRPRYNINPLASSSLGVKRSAEYRERKSASMIGRKQSPELIARRAAGMIGHAVSAEARERIGAKHIGNTHALGAVRGEETRARMSKAQTQRFEELRNRGIVPKPALGHIVSETTRAGIAAKLKGRKRSPEAIAKHRETLAAKRSGHMLQSVDYEVTKS